MQFPSFDGGQPKIWIDNYQNYFSIYSIPEKLWVTATSMHLTGNASKWFQACKQTHQNIGWKAFCEAVQTKFGSDDYRSAIADILNLKQTSTVEDYTTKFQALQFDVTMHSYNFDELFFATTYVNDLKEEIRAVMEPQVPTTIERVAIIGKGT